MHNQYEGVTTRFLRSDERQVVCEDNSLPLVIEAHLSKDKAFLQQFLRRNSAQILADITTFGAVLLRGFTIESDEDFENTVTQIDGFQGISDAFMSEEGRTHVGSLRFVLHTNSVYKTGGTLYLGGFHSENYYSPDVPGYIFFCCLQASTTGGETGMINMEAVYNALDPNIQQQLEKNNFFVAKWTLQEVAKRYNISHSKIEQICAKFKLPIVGSGTNRLILLYKPNVLINPKTQKKSLQINLFEITRLNKILRKHFLQDYQGKEWFWHRFVWRLPASVLKILEYCYLMCASFFHSPKQSIAILKTKLARLKSSFFTRKFDKRRVEECFNKNAIDDLAGLMRQHYSSCLWQKGDILLIDNKKIMHAGMPGSGERIIRALIGNSLDLSYLPHQTGLVEAVERPDETIGYYADSHVNNTGA